MTCSTLSPKEQGGAGSLARHQTSLAVVPQRGFYLVHYLLPPHPA